MKLIELKCKSCGAILKVDADSKKIRCGYCRSEFIIDNEETIHTYIKIDEARLKEAETDQMVKMKKLQMSEKKYEDKKNKFKIEIIKIILTVIAVVLTWYFIFELPFEKMKKESDIQEEELTKLVNEIIEDVGNEKFDEAYIKAQSLKYTEGWSSEIEEKWDNTRKEVINYIIEEEKEVTSKSSHKKEGDGIFENLFK